jgi:hypothetical protein
MDDMGSCEPSRQFLFLAFGFGTGGFPNGSAWEDVTTEFAFAF